MQIVGYLDPDHLLGRADRSNNESVFRKLVEIALTYDLDDYEKTRFLEGLLVFQCEFVHSNSLGSLTLREFMTARHFPVA